MKVEIKGIEFSNKGAEMMLLSIIAALDLHIDEYELVLTPGHLLPYGKRAKLGAWQKFSFNKAGIDWTAIGNFLPDGLTRLFKHFGIVVEKEIDLVLDASGFVYSDKWDPQRMTDSVKHLQRIAKRQVPYVFLPQAFGPFEKPQSQQLASQLIAGAAIVVARDNDSFAALKALDNQSNILQYPDFTPLLDASTAALPENLASHYACIIPNSKMVPKRDPQKREQYMAFLEQAVLVVQALGLIPVVLNHEGEKDRQLCQDLLARLIIKPLFYDGLDVLVVKQMIGKSVFNLSSRYHGCISGLSQGVPTLATSWSHKYEQLYAYYQCPDHLIAVTDEVGILEQKMTEILDQREYWSERLLKRASEHRQTIEQMWTEIFAILK